jgi:hypothetical protein
MPEFSGVWLRKQGLNLPPRTLRQLSDTLEAVLEMRVGYVLAARLTDSQIEEFETILSRTDENDTNSERINWLEKNYPRYNKVVRYQKVKLSRQIRNSSDKTAFIKGLSKAEIAY